MLINYSEPDGMFKGIYNGKCLHKPDITAVLGRAWAAGVDRIIVCNFKSTYSVVIIFIHLLILVLH